MRRGDPWKSGRNRLDARRWKRAALPDQIMQSRVMLQLLHISGFIQVDYRAGRYCSVVPITKKKQQKSRLLAITLCAWYWYIIICSFHFSHSTKLSACAGIGSQGTKLDIPQPPRLIIQRDLSLPRTKESKCKVDISRKEETVLSREERKATDQYNFILHLIQCQLSPF
jgi:hypothetical protein